MKKFPLVSIVIPTFNRINFLKETIESCKLQTIECEIIVVDHGSNDGTKEYFENIKETNIQYIRKEKDHGPIYAWLDGLLHASYELVHLQFDDDIIKPNFIEKCVSLLSEDVGFVFCAANLMDERSNLLPKKMYSDLFTTGKHRSNKIKKFALHKMISPACTLMRKQDILDSLYIGKLPFQKYTYHGVGPDLYMMLLAISRYQNFAYINEALVIFREHSSSITSQSHLDKTKMFNLQKSYDEVRKFFLIVSLQKNFIFKLYIFMSLINLKNLYFLINKIKNPKWQKLLDSLKKQYKKNN